MAKKGHVPWNKGKTKETDEIVAEIARKNRETPKSPEFTFKGKHHTKEANEKNRLAHLGKKHSKKTRTKMCGRIPWNKNLTKDTDGRLRQLSDKMSRTMTRYFAEHPEAREYLRQMNLGKQYSDEKKEKHRKAMSGGNNHQWIDGRSYEPYTAEFRNVLRYETRKRDGYKCRVCWKPENGHAHDVHHINYDKNDNGLSNLTTLCIPCHRRTYVNRELWPYLLELMDLGMIWEANGVAF